jgi:chorismate synthase
VIIDPGVGFDKRELPSVRKTGDGQERSSARRTVARSVAGTANKSLLLEQRRRAWLPVRVADWLSKAGICPAAGEKKKGGG